MEDNRKHDDFIDIAGYMNFIERRKVCIIFTTLVFLAAGYIFALLAPPAYTISAVIEPPSIETTQMFRRITRREFNARANDLLNELRPDIVRESGKRQVIIVFSVRGEQNADSGLRIMDELLKEFKKYYSSRVDNESERLKRLLEARRAEKGKAAAVMQKAADSPEHENLAPTLTLLYNEILYLRSLFPEQNIRGLESRLAGTHNIKVLEKPHISEILEPRMSLSLAIGFISGIMLGITIGAAKDVLHKKNSYRK